MTTASSPAATAFVRAGGEAVLRPAMERFVQQLAVDPMIGFLFGQADLPRLALREYQLAAQFLGAEVEYEGRPLQRAHAPFPITGGMFARRRFLLEQELRRSEVADDIVDLWLAHTDSLRAQITPQPGGRCDTRATGGPLLSRWEPPAANPVPVGNPLEPQ
jgi:truncated hemoglobin YjbI